MIVNAIQAGIIPYVALFLQGEVRTTMSALSWSATHGHKHGPDVPLASADVADTCFNC
jgi:hypothetical protein